MSTDCEDCTQSTKREWHGFHANCQGCNARAAARTPHFRRVRDAGRLDRQYRTMLQQFGLTHEEVRAAHQADFGERGNA
jgi:hypothetical protein